MVEFFNSYINMLVATPSGVPSSRLLGYILCDLGLKEENEPERITLKFLDERVQRTRVQSFVEIGVWQSHRCSVLSPIFEIRRLKRYIISCFTSTYDVRCSVLFLAIPARRFTFPSNSLSSAINLSS